MYEAGNKAGLPSVLASAVRAGLVVPSTNVMTCALLQKASRHSTYGNEPGNDLRMRYKGIICQKKLLWQFYSIYRTVAPEKAPIERPKYSHQLDHLSTCDRNA